VETNQRVSISCVCQHSLSICFSNYERIFSCETSSTTSLFSFPSTFCSGVSSST